MRRRSDSENWTASCPSGDGGRSEGITDAIDGGGGGGGVVSLLEWPRDSSLKRWAIFFVCVWGRAQRKGTIIQLLITVAPKKKKEEHKYTQKSLDTIEVEFTPFPPFIVFLSDLIYSFSVMWLKLNKSCARYKLHNSAFRNETLIILFVWSKTESNSKYSNLIDAFSIWISHLQNN